MADIDDRGPQGFRRVYEALRNAFIGTPGSSIVTVSSNPGQVPVESKLQMVAMKARASDPMTKSRQNSTGEKLAAWDGKLRPLVDNQLRRAFHPENYARMFWVMHTSSNVMRRIINDVSILYENPAIRSLKDPEKTITETVAPVDGEQPLLGTGEEEKPPVAPGLGIGGEEPADVPGEATPAVELNTGDPDIDALADVLELSGAKVGAEQTPFDKLMEAYDLDMLMDLVEKLTCICPAVWVRPVVTYKKDMQTMQNDPTTGKLNFIIYTPDHADVIPDPENPTDAMAFYYYGTEQTVNGEIRVVHFWNRSMYIKFDMEWKELARVPNTTNRLPVTVFRQQLPRTGYFVDGIGDDLYEGTIEVCTLKTLQNSRAKDGAFKQLAIQGSGDDVPQDLVMGGPTPIVLGEENTAVVLDMQANLKQFTEMWEAREVSLASTYGISAASYKQEGAPQSGFAKKLDQDRVLKENKRRRKFFADGEQDLYENIASTLQVQPIPEIGVLDPKAKMTVDFSEPTFEEDPNTQARVDALQLKFNVASIIDILRRSEPDLDDVELIKMAYKNKRINDAFMTSDQVSLTDLLATRANVGGSFGSVGANGAAPGEDKPPKEDGGGVP